MMNDGAPFFHSKEKLSFLFLEFILENSPYGKDKFSNRFVHKRMLNDVVFRRCSRRYRSSSSSRIRTGKPKWPGGDGRGR
jgi:hypothetical protein